MWRIWTSFFFFAKMNSLQMSRAPRSPPHSSGRCRVYTDGGSSQCVTNAARRTMKALCQPFRRDKRKTESVSLMTLAVPHIAPPHRHHNATPVQVFCAAGSVQFLVVFAVGRGSAAPGLQRQQPPEQDGLSASLHCFSVTSDTGRVVCQQVCK